MMLGYDISWIYMNLASGVIVSTRFTSLGKKSSNRWWIFQPQDDIRGIPMVGFETSHAVNIEH